jgi:hypothetical protein
MAENTLEGSIDNVQFSIYSVLMKLNIWVKFIGMQWEAENVILIIAWRTQILPTFLVVVGIR